MQKFAILGLHPKLSLAELETVIDAQIHRRSNEVAIFKSDVEAQKLQNTLGGSKKIGEILGVVNDHQEIEKHLITLLKDHKVEGKLKFGISVYNLGNPKRTREIQRYMEKLGISIKKAVKDSGQSVRLVTSRESSLSTVVVKKNKLVEKGIEFVLLVDESEIRIGVTKAIQDFEDWSHRDYERPGRDAESGMLPPKLARMMINLAGVNPASSYLLDPFCGSGTMLMEASLLGFDNVIGADISKKAISDTRKNLTWLIREGYKMADSTLINSKAEDLNKSLDKNSIDLIVTEPFLGNPRSGRDKAKDVEKAIRELTKLYKVSFTELDKILKPDGVIVMISPVHFVNEQTFSVPTIEIMKNLGYITIRKPLLYKREKQFVGRNILVFKKR